MQKFLKTLAGVAIATALATSLPAAPISVVFLGTGTNVDLPTTGSGAFTFSSGAGLDLNVSSLSLLGGAMTLTAHVTGTTTQGPTVACANDGGQCSSDGTGGIGVRWNDGTFGEGGSHLDNDPRVEWFSITINSGSWKLTDVATGDLTGSDQWEISFNGGSTFTEFSNLGFAPDHYVFDQLLDSNGIIIRAANGEGSGDTFRLYSLTFEDQAIPEPATFGLLGAGLLAFGIVANRRRAKNN